MARQVVCYSRALARVSYLLIICIVQLRSSDPIQLCLLFQQTKLNIHFYKNYVLFIYRVRCLFGH